MGHTITRAGDRSGCIREGGTPVHAGRLHRWLHAARWLPRLTMLAAACASSPVLAQTEAPARAAAPVQVSAALQERCEARVPKQVVSIQTVPIAYTLDTSLPHREIAELAGKAKAGSFVLGLTRARFHTRISYHATLVHDRANQRECLLPSLAVGLSYPSVVVYIGSEFPEGSCAYREILMHELQHVQAFQQHMAQLEISVRQALQERFSMPLYAELGRSKSMMSDEINGVWKPFILAEQRKVDVLQKQVDAPEEVRRVVRACGAEFRNTLLQSRPVQSQSSPPGE